MKKAIPFIIIAIIAAFAAVMMLISREYSNNDHPINDTYSMTDDTSAPDSEDEGAADAPAYKDVNVTVEFKNADEFPQIGDLKRSLIDEYFTLYYASLGSNDAADMSHLYYFDTDYEQSLIRTMIDYQIRIRKNMHIDLSYDQFNVGVEFISVEETKKGTQVTLYENNFVNHAFAGDVTSYTSGVEHRFTLKEGAGKCYIISHSEITGVYTLITDKFDEMLERKRLTLSALTNNQLNQLFDELNDSLIISADQGLQSLYYEKTKYNFDPESFALKLSCDNPYDPQAALAYSYEWAGKYEMKRNPLYLAYDEYGGNCNNFTSQCLYASGISMDLSGDIYHQWKWYGDDINGYSTPYGRTMSWTGVDFFWQYCKENKGRGIVAECGGNIYSGRPGDILQYVDENVGVHSVIISKVIYDDHGNVVDFLVNSNTTDKVDCPMSIYGYTNFRLIRIAGWNN